MAWMNFSDGPFAEALVWTILHSFWQFVLIALGMSFLLKMYQNHKSAVRYYISLTSMFVALLTFVLTFIYFYHDGNGDATLFPERKIQEVSAIIAQISVWDRLNACIALYQKPIFLTWILGVTLFGLRLIGSLVYVEYLIKSMSPIYHQNVYKTFTHMARYFGIKDSIRIGESKHINSPMILGLIKPVILFPIGMINQLETEEVDSILAHELAHFVRKDIYINVIQTTIQSHSLLPSCYMVDLCQYPCGTGKLL